ncbi:MAG: RNA-binding protein [Bacteroidota bacterium]|nr:RNA-binding protein [Bacteroidota bacterium]
MNIFVGSLNFRSEEDKLQELFERYGAVSSVKIIKDQVSGRSKGFGFVVMDNDDEARQAIQELNGSSFDGREIIVNEARPREERPEGSGGSRGGYGGGGGGGSRGGSGGYGGGGGGGYSSGPRQMYPAVCSECGKDTEVPFQPRSDKPVYCRECFQLRRTAAPPRDYSY